MSEGRYILLYHDGWRVRAAEATHLLAAGEFPNGIRIGRDLYQRLDEETFIFWDEFRDSTNRTVGYSIHLPESRAFANARLWVSQNVTMDDKELSVFLQECSDPVLECVQGFCSEFYRHVSDPRECLLVMYDFSGNPTAFELNHGPGGQPPVVA